MLTRRSVAVLFAAILALATAACSGGDDDDDATAATTPPTTGSPSTSAAPTATTPGSAAAATTAAADAYPVTVEHAFGSTTFESRPTRIATIGLQWTDVMLALDVTPIAYIAEPLAGPGDIYPWQQGRLDGATGVTITTVEDIPYEQLAALDPDLILITYLAEDQEIYDRLAGIAPTIGLLGDRQVDRWQDMLEVAGRFLGEPAQAAAVTAEVEGLVQETAERFPGLRGETFALANYIPGDSIYVVADEDDGSSVFFQQLGMQLDPDVLAAADGVSGRANISLEQVGLLDGDLLVIFSNAADPSDLVGYDQLGVVAAGAASEVDYAAVVGLNTPTPLSIPYSLEIVRPQLEAAAA